MSFGECCIKTFRWEGTPTGKESTLANNKCYVTGDNKDAAVLIIHDIFGWSYNNVRLLADHYASEIGATVYVPDFFGGFVVNFEDAENDRFDKIDLAALTKEQSREVRYPEMLACAKALKADLGFKRVGTIGFCYGGWAVCQLAAEKSDTPVVDAISFGHPSWLNKGDIDGLAVPTQVLAPEHDHAYTKELKSHTFETLLAKNLAFDYQHFPGVAHGAFIRGSDKHDGEREAMARAKNAAVSWFKLYLK
ncbi:putative hydrolase [Xylariaceae sp. FL1019]|nr:putative hydrolase [Xylariaceae sp. FL1019]